MSEALENDILVAGTGPAGLVTALLAAEAGFQTTLVGPAVNLDDARTTTLMVPALEVLNSLGVDLSFDGRAAELRTMRIIDGTRRLFRSPVATFHAGEIDEHYFGLNIPNQVLNRSLADAIEQTGLPWRKTMVSDWRTTADAVFAMLGDGGPVAAKLAAAADGRHSPARKAAGISVSTRPYRQSAFVSTLRHQRGHGDISTEFHTETGPFTVVPLPGDRSSLVWVVRPEEAEMLLSLDIEELARRIEDRMDSMLGKISVDGKSQAYPLCSGLPSAFAVKRIALVGEAAHVFPPIGAQGLNLGIRDALDLVSVAKRHGADPGAPAVLAAYEQARRPDILARTGAVALLNQSLLSDFLPAQIARSAGLSMLSGFAPLRGFFMREGMRPGSGFTNLFSSVREQVRR